MGGAYSTYGVGRGVYGGLVGKLRERDHIKDPIVDGMIILRMAFKNWDVETWTGLSWLRIGTGGGNL
jgi:hypothetical protein